MPTRFTPGRMGRANDQRMRTTPLAGRKAWFGPRRLGWGLGPGARLARGLGGGGGCRSRRHRGGHAGQALLGAALIVVVVPIAVSFLKGTSPGGPRNWEEFRASRDSGNPPADPGGDQL